MMVIGGRTHRLVATNEKSSEKVDNHNKYGTAIRTLFGNNPASSVDAGGRRATMTPDAENCLTPNTTCQLHRSSSANASDLLRPKIETEVRDASSLVDLSLKPESTCCQQQESLSVREESEKWCRLPFVVKQALICLLYYFLLAIFCVLGALATQAFELPAEISARHSEEHLEMQVFEFLLNHTSWQVNGSELNKFSELFGSYQRALKHTVKCGYDSNETLWSFLNSVFYTATIVTTIGYGHLAPKTNGGRIAMIVIAVFGIPLFLLNVTQVGRIFVDMLEAANKHLRKRRHADEESQGKQDMLQAAFYLSLVIITVFILLMSALLIAYEDWEFIEAVYFTFGTLATIGLGDVMPMNVGLLIGFSIFLIIGLSLVTTFLELTEAKMQQMLVRVKRTTRLAVLFGIRYRKERPGALSEWSKIVEMIARMDSTQPKENEQDVLHRATRTETLHSLREHKTNAL